MSCAPHGQQAGENYFSWLVLLRLYPENCVHCEEGHGEDQMKSHHLARAGASVPQGWWRELGLPGLLNQQQLAAPQRGAAKVREQRPVSARAEEVAGTQSPQSGRLRPGFKSALLYQAGGAALGRVPKAAVKSV